MKLLLLSFFLCASVLFSQKLNGIIYEQSEYGKNTPLPGVNIFWANTTIGTASNIDGGFSLIKTAEESPKLIISHIMYRLVWTIHLWYFKMAIHNLTSSSSGRKNTPLSMALERQGKLGASCRVQVPVGKGLASHPYWVLRLWRRAWELEQNRWSVHKALCRP